MTHPPNRSNGCSLEDCHTNLFALTDLDGIKWRRLSAENTFCLEPLDDPVLQSFTKCIQNDILCVWRRVQRSSDHKAPDQLSCNKELWIFWYGDEPPNLRQLLAQELLEQEQGSWDNGLSYECRTLLFRALHNLIERCLSSQNFVRIGKWFVQPYDFGNVQTLTNKSTHLSIRFSFFLHGESQVCASIDVRQHMPLRRLQPYHLTVATQDHQQVPVILAPYGLAGVITGQTYRESDPNTQRLLDDWRQLYVLRDPDLDGYNRMPPAVEVVVAGTRMRYPSSFVLVTADVETDLVNRNPGLGPVLQSPHVSLTTLTPPSSPLNGSMMAGPDVPLKVLSSGPDVQMEPPIGVPQGNELSERVIEKVWQDSAVTPSQRHQGEELDPMQAASWDYQDPVHKNACHCPKNKGNKRPGGSSQSKSVTPPSLKNKSGDKPEKSMGRHGRAATPFHRRSTITDEFMQHDIDIMTQQMPVYGGAVARATNSQQLSMRSTPSAYETIDSPHSAAPSPLVASQSQPSQVTNGDPTMPTLSPHPPVIKDEKPVTHSSANESQDGLGTSSTVPAPGPSTPGASTTPGGPSLTASGVPNGTLTPMVNGTTVPGDLFINSKGPTGPTNTGVKSELAALLMDTVKVENVNSWLDSVKAKSGLHGGLKRPILPGKNYDDAQDELVTESLYDFNMLNAWLEQPVKRQKRDNKMESKPSYNSSNQTSASAHLSAKMRGAERDTPPSPQVPARDPYEFSDEDPPSASDFTKRPSLRQSREDSISRPNSFNTKLEDDSRRSSDSSVFKDENMSPTSEAALSHGPSSDLYSEIALRPTFNDLDHMFESDSESSDADAIQVPTPPGGPRITEDGMKLPIKGSSLASCTVPDTGGPTNDVLSRMYPTPPSHENQHSPNSGPEPVTETAVVEHHQMVAKKEIRIVSSMSDILDRSDVWSFVFRPIRCAPFQGSDKYSPVELWSSRLPPLTKPPHLLYKPSWQYHHHHHHPLPVIDKHHQQQQQQNQYNNIPSIEAPRSNNTDHVSSNMERSPAFQGNLSQQRTPLSYDLQSPASNASSYMRNLNSVDNQGTVSSIPEVNSLVVNIMLSDSLLNVFKDHNFDSCPICVCNMNIKGSDIGSYLPADKDAEPQFRCTCGFSAVTNRKYGVNSGLFYEDEVDITGIRDERLEQRKPSLLDPEFQNKDGIKGDQVPYAILELLQEQFTALLPSAIVLYQHYNECSPQALAPKNMFLNLLEIQDGCEACYTALEAGRQSMDNCSSSKLEDPVHRRSCLHRWPFIQATSKIPVNTQDVSRMLKSLQPVLQDTLQRKRTTSFWEAVYTVSGPLTWKDFHLLAGRGSDEVSEPQPIPHFLAGHDKDWLSLAPHALRYWDKLLLEPYSKQHDVAYIVVAPDNDYILNAVQVFFKEMSTVYELCRLGKHCAISKDLRDGIIRISKKAASRLSEERVNDWFTYIGNGPMSAKLKLYAQVCAHQLAPYLSRQTLDRTLFDGEKKSNTQQSSQLKPEPSPAPPASPASTPGGPATPNPGGSDDKDEGLQKDTQDSGPEMDADSSGCPSIIIYMIDPFTYAHNQWPQITRLAMMGLLRCYQELISNLPEHMQSHVHPQVIPLQTVLDFQEHRESQFIRQLCMSVYTQCRRNIPQQIVGRSLTGFGPAATGEEMLKNDRILPGKSLVSRLFNPPYVLSTQKEKHALFDNVADKPEQADVLYVSYCLSEDQRWLLAVATDSTGELLETCTINIDIPNRNRRKKASARKIGLAKLWDFIQGVLSLSACPWRIVIGRFGRIGHGELKGWSGLLSKKNLGRTSKRMKEMCRMCNILNPQQTPSILSACLVSMDLHQSIHIFTDSIKVEEKSASSVPLNTPQDASVTHILVFPTSTTAQANIGAPGQDSHMGQLDDHMPDPFGGGLDDTEFMQGMDEELGDINDLFGPGVLTSPVGSPTGSPKNLSAPGSPTQAGGMPSINGFDKGAAANNPNIEAQEEQSNLLMQPLAMGYYVSTAPTGPLPRWIWSHCPQKEDVCPNCFKAALHIHSPNVQQAQDDIFHHAAPNRNSHPLDSSFTCDVLRYVLESYNALSWLTMDPISNDRRSCLPAHFVVLMQLYNAMDKFV